MCNRETHQRIAALVLAIAFSMPTLGCYTFHVYQVGGLDGRETGNTPSTEWKHKTLSASAWGAGRQDLPVDNCKLGNGQRLGIEEIKIETNFGYILASTVTLGIWVPLRVSWRCAKPPVTTGKLE